MSAAGHDLPVYAPVRWLRSALIAAIRVYQLVVSPRARAGVPLRSRAARPTPIEAIARRGVDPRQLARAEPDRPLPSLGWLRLRPGALRSGSGPQPAARVRTFVHRAVALDDDAAAAAPKPPRRSDRGGFPPAPAPSSFRPRCAGTRGRACRRRSARGGGADRRPSSRSRSSGRSTSPSSRTRARRCATGSSFGTATATAIRSGSSVRDDALATAATPFTELVLGDLSQQVWRVESRSDTEVRFALGAQRRVSCTRRTRSPTTDTISGYALMCRTEPRRPIAPAFLVEMPLARAPGQRLPRAGRRGAARRRARDSAAREPGQRGLLRLGDREEGRRAG